jgi:tetratricopeptide (TPR) repeat protein
MKLKAGDAAGALTAYKESLEIRRDLAKDMSNTVAQRGLAISDENVADALKKLGKLEDALPYDEADIAIFERLLQLDNNSETALDDLAIALSRVGTDLRKLGRLDEAFVDYDRSLALRRRLANAHPERSDLRTCETMSRKPPGTWEA